jgi:hypothetical protein
MATTQELLSELNVQKNALVNNLNTKGVTASPSEGFTTLVPKVLDIMGGGDVLGAGSPAGNLMASMLYAITAGTAVTGEFTLETAIPNTETLIFDTNLETIKGFAFINVDWDGTTETGKERNAFGAALINPNDGSAFLYAYSFSMNLATGGSLQDSSLPLRHTKSIRIDGGSFYAAGSYNGNANYTPFAPGMKYIWIAW